MAIWTSNCVITRFTALPLACAASCNFQPTFFVRSTTVQRWRPVLDSFLFGGLTLVAVAYNYSHSPILSSEAVVLCCALGATFIGFHVIAPLQYALARLDLLHTELYAERVQRLYDWNVKLVMLWTLGLAVELFDVLLNSSAATSAASAAASTAAASFNVSD